MILDIKPAASVEVQNANGNGEDRPSLGTSTWSPASYHGTNTNVGQPSSRTSSSAPVQALESSPPGYEYRGSHVPIVTPLPATYIPTPSLPYTPTTSSEQNCDVLLRELERNLNDLQLARQGLGHRTLNQTARLIHVLFSTSSFRNSESSLREADLEWQAGSTRVRVQEELVLMGMRKLERLHPNKYDRRMWLKRADKLERTMKASDTVQSSWTNLPVVIMSERLGILGTQQESSLEGLMKGFIILLLIPFACFVGGVYLCGAILVAIRRILYGLLHVCTLGRV